MSSQSSVDHETVIEAHCKTLRHVGRLHVLFYCVAGEKNVLRQSVSPYYRIWAITPPMDIPVDRAGNDLALDHPQQPLCCDTHCGQRGSGASLRLLENLFLWRRGCLLRENSELVIKDLVVSFDLVGFHSTILCPAG